MKKISSWAEWFDRCAKHYQDPRMKMAYYKDGATGEPISMETLHAIHEDVWKKLRADSQCSLLDVGSGMGLFVQAFQNRLSWIVGTDISFHMMKDAASLNPQGKFLQCDVSALPFAAKTFDRLLCYSIFHYLPDDSQARKTIAEFRRVVKNDGMILIGDVLYPFEKAPFKKNSPSSAWWPSSLKHRLQKKTFPPEFFKDYCQKNKLTYEILAQDIPGKDKNERYDVAIRF